MDYKDFTSRVVEKLLKQKDAHDSIVDALKKRIDDLERECQGYRAGVLVNYLFFARKHPELIPEFVELAYKEEPSLAKEVLAEFHQDMLDLSTLDCTGDDFKPWRT